MPVDDYMLSLRRNCSGPTAHLMPVTDSSVIIERGGTASETLKRTVQPPAIVCRNLGLVASIDTRLEQQQTN